MTTSFLALCTAVGIAGTVATAVAVQSNEPAPTVHSPFASVSSEPSPEPHTGVHVSSSAEERFPEHTTPHEVRAGTVRTAEPAPTRTRTQGFVMPAHPEGWPLSPEQKSHLLDAAASLDAAGFRDQASDLRRGLSDHGSRTPHDADPIVQELRRLRADVRELTAMVAQLRMGSGSEANPFRGPEGSVRRSGSTHAPAGSSRARGGRRGSGATVGGRPSGVTVGGRGSGATVGGRGSGATIGGRGGQTSGTASSGRSSNSGSASNSDQDSSSSSSSSRDSGRDSGRSRNSSSSSNSGGGRNSNSSGTSSSNSSGGRGGNTSGTN